MSERTLSDFLMHGDHQLAAPAPNPAGRLRAKMGLPPREMVPAEGTPAREWLRHVEAGRIG